MKLLLVLALIAGIPQAAAVEEQSLSAELREHDERLLTAVHRGDRATWERLTTADFLYVEEGVIQPRREFLDGLAEDQLDPLIIREYRVERIGDTAIVVHLDDVPGIKSPDGSAARYLMTETWQRIAGTWKLRLVHIEAIRTDPPQVSLLPQQIDELVGTYKSGQRTIKIRRDGQRILARQGAAEERELRAETRDVLFLPGDTRMRRVFMRDSSGRAIAVAERYENLEVLYHREP